VRGAVVPHCSGCASGMERLHAHGRESAVPTERPPVIEEPGRICGRDKRLARSEWG
jgi:hypothetical protein